MPKKKAVPARQGVRRADGDVPAVKSISRAIEITNCIRDGFATLTDIAEHCGLSKSTVHRLLRALEATGLISQDQHRYYLGPLLTGLVTSYQTGHADLITCSLREVRRLNKLLEETVHISIMPTLQNFIISETPSMHDLRVTQENKRIGFTYNGATVRVLLAQFPPEQLSIMMKSIRLASVTDKSIVNKETLMKLIDEARDQGYAVSCGEKIPGAIGIAAPIFNYPHPAAVAVIGPDIRILPRIDEFIKEIKTGAARISANVAEMSGAIQTIATR